MSTKNNTYTSIAILLLIILTSVLRIIALPYHNLDIDGYLEWYTYIVKHGFASFRDDFSVYAFPYLYLLWLAEHFRHFVSPELAIKLIPLPFDLLSAFIVYKIVRIQHQIGNLPILAGAGFLCLPTIIANSSLWGQIDSLYTSFLLLCFYLCIKRKPFWAVLSFGVAFSIKAQAIFLLPFLGILLLKKYIRWHYVLLIPMVYLAVGLPAAYAGRSWGSILTVYFGQLGHFEELAKTAPNLYIFIPFKYYHPVLEIGLSVFLVVMLTWTWINWKAQPINSDRQFALTALASVTLVPFLLPKMHDRYFYPADAFSFVTAFLIPELWFLPILFQISSGFAYTIFLFDASPIFVYIAAIINAFLVIYITYLHVHLLNGIPQDSIN